MIPNSGNLEFYRIAILLSVIHVFLTAFPVSALARNGSSRSQTNWETTDRLGSWIWTDRTHDQQICRLWKSFVIPDGQQVMRARLFITADNAFRLFLDGREIGRGSEWRRLTEYDLSLVLEPGTHVLAVEAFNDYAEAGVILGLNIDLAKGEKIHVITDSSWHVVPANERGWESRTRPSSKWAAATVAGEMGSAPWWKNNPITTTVPPVMPIHLRFWQQGWFQITTLTIFGVVILICLRLATKLSLQSKEQKLLQRERARIARDIHDDLGASLTQLVLLGEMAQKDLPAKSETRTQIDGLCEKAREILRSMEEIIWVVNSRRDTLSDFATYVCKYAQNFLQSSPIRCRLEIEPELPPLPFDLPIRRNLFLAVKEAINNAAKYSDAKKLFLRIRRLGQNVEVIIEDDGKGFDPSDADPERNGLTNMTQRMNEVEGTCRIISQPGAGCRVEFVAPLEHSQQQHWWNWHRRKKNKTMVSPGSRANSAPTSPRQLINS